MRAARHPMGRGYATRQAEALARWPAETEALDQILTDWRQRLRELARKYGR